MSSEELVWAREFDDPNAEEHPAFLLNDKSNDDGDDETVWIRWTSTRDVVQIPKRCIRRELTPRGSRVKKPKPKYANGTAVSKIFFDDAIDDERPFSGEVVEYYADDKLYSVRYEDGDVEDLNEKELASIVQKNGQARKKNKRKQKVKPAGKKPRTTSSDVKAAGKKPRTAAEESDGEEDFSEPEILTTGKTPRRSAKKKVVYEESDSDMNFEESEDDAPKKKKIKSTGKAGTPRSSSKKKTSKGKPSKKKTKSSDSDSDNFQPDSEPDDESFAADSESETEVEQEDEDYGAASSKGSKKKATSAKGKKQSASKKAPDTKKEPKRKMSEMFKPTNNPIYWNKGMSSAEIQKNLNFLDPCGMEATDDIIDRLVGEQIDKIANLLKKSLTAEDVDMLNNAKKQREDINAGKEEGTLGSQSNPLILGTACSGTDAPALALMLVQEQLEKRGMGGIFHHEHVFSCEKEPFKQSYLARNFDSILYPDLTMLTDDPPRDVYGQEKQIPSFNLFVAGTSCKNFSMLMSNKRLDIEDKGCSGETFLAACELLFKEKPRYARYLNKCFKCLMLLPSVC